MNIVVLKEISVQFLSVMVEISRQLPIILEASQVDDDSSIE